MADLHKFTSKEVLNKVLLDSGGSSVAAFSHTTAEALNAALDATNSRLNVSLAGGTISGDVTITGDLTVSGGGTLAFDEILEGTQVIDVTNTEAFLVRKNSDGGDVFIVDTTNSRVGIGGTPTADLHVFGQTVRIAHDTPEFVLQDTSAFSSGTGPSMYFQGNQTGETLQTFAEIQGVSTSSANEGNLIFKTRSGGSTDERMRIYQTGNVEFKANIIMADDTSIGISDSDERIEFDGAGDISVLGANFGIGLSDPSYKLEVGASVTGDWISRINNTATSGNPNGLLAKINQSDSTGMIFAALADSSYRMVVLGNGNVGIGTTAPETKFTIDQTADDNGIRIYGYDDVSSRYGEIFVDSSGYFNIDASTDRGIEIKGHANDFFVNSGADLFVRMTYDSKMGVGTTSPSEVLTVSGNIDLKNSSGFAKIDNSGTLSMADDATVTISSSRNGSALILVYETGSGIGALFFTCFGLAVTRLAGTSLTANSDSDGDLCCFNSGHTITVKNRLGDTKSVVITVLGGNVY